MSSSSYMNTDSSKKSIQDNPLFHHSQLHHTTTLDPAPAMLATANHYPSETPQYFSGTRPTLPPISQIHQPSNLFQPPSSGLSVAEPQSHTRNHASSTIQHQPHHQPRPPFPHGSRLTQTGPTSSNESIRHQNMVLGDSDLSVTSHPRPYNHLKRPYESIERSQHLHVNTTYTDNDLRGPAFSHTRSPYSEVSTPTTSSSYPTMGNAPIFSRGQSESSASMNTNRCSLLLRQQPRAARAGPDGKDRRAIDPPPVLQLMMNDFDPNSPSDLAELRSSFWVVHCRLVSSQSPKKDLSTLSSVGEDGSREIQRLLLGTAVASPFFCNDDPDPGTVPTHPITKTPVSEQPSPSQRFLPLFSSSSVSSSEKEQSKGKSKVPDPTKIAGTFFIFADLSVRKAGEYRLEFSLMKVEASTLHSGSTLPIIHSVTSSVFRVVNAKDFDQVQPSTSLVKGLIDRGAGFPLKLKKGTREGQRGRRARSDGEMEVDPAERSDTEEEEDDDDGGG